MSSLPATASGRVPRLFGMTNNSGPCEGAYRAEVEREALVIHQRQNNNNRPAIHTPSPTDGHLLPRDLIPQGLLDEQDEAYNAQIRARFGPSARSSSGSIESIEAPLSWRDHRSSPPMPPLMRQQHQGQRQQPQGHATTVSAEYAALADPSSTNLYITGIPITVQSDVIGLLSQYGGRVVSHRLTTDAQGNRRGPVLARMESRAQAERVIQYLNGQLRFGSPTALTVRIADSDAQKAYKQHLVDKTPEKERRLEAHLADAGLQTVWPSSYQYRANRLDTLRRELSDAERVLAAAGQQRDEALAKVARINAEIAAVPPADQPSPPPGWGYGTPSPTISPPFPDAPTMQEQMWVMVPEEPVYLTEKVYQGWTDTNTGRQMGRTHWNNTLEVNVGDIQEPDDFDPRVGAELEANNNTIRPLNSPSEAAIEPAAADRWSYQLWPGQGGHYNHVLPMGRSAVNVNAVAGPSRLRDIELGL